MGRLVKSGVIDVLIAILYKLVNIVYIIMLFGNSKLPNDIRSRVWSRANRYQNCLAAVLMNIKPGVLCLFQLCLV